MADERKDGGPAFPQSLNPEGPFGGMTLRDWFAGQALVGLVHPGWEADPIGAPEKAYQIANAMLQARQKGADE